MTGVEAFLRWHHPELGEISPTSLIPLAEKTDLIQPIGEWILRAACHQNKIWQESGIAPFPITVNLSLRQFQQPNLGEIITNILRETNLAPQGLILELTESIVMENGEYSQGVLSQLQNLGVKICLDDFGIGLGSLACLQQFKINSLKIHPSFTTNLHQNSGDRAIINAIINLGRHFNTKVIAEGIENLQQLEVLQKLNCEEAQGFFFAKPLKTDDITAFLSQSKIQTFL